MNPEQQNQQIIVSFFVLVFNNGLIICWCKQYIPGDDFTNVTFSITFSSIFCFVITLNSSANYINNASASQVWLYEYTRSTARIGNDWSPGNIFCLIIGI